MNNQKILYQQQIKKINKNCVAKLNWTELN